MQPGTYVIATSGGVDSMVLLDLLRRQPELNLIVAHLDHGIRHDSDLDRRLVQEISKQHNLKFIYDRANLGEVSEATARKARYDFLHKIRKTANADAIVTAHHQDDLLETAVLNLLRGTGRRGLTSLKSTDVIKRPLLHLSKKQLIEYAKQNNLKWREDSTNQDVKYLRNYIRHKILPRFSPTDRKIMLGIIKSLHETNAAIDHDLANHLHMQPATDKLDRHWFIMLPHNVSREVMLTWLRRHEVEDISSRTLERLVAAAKTLSPGNQADVDKKYFLQIKKTELALSGRDR